MLNINIRNNTMNKIKDTQYCTKRYLGNTVIICKQSRTVYKLPFLASHCTLISLTPLGTFVPVETTYFGKHCIYLVLLYRFTCI